jgi:hypothetical protein
MASTSELPPCYQCGSPLWLAVGRTKPREESLHALVCLECTRDKKETCQCPKHSGSTLLPASAIAAYAWRNSKRINGDSITKIRACFRCAQRLKLSLWVDYEASKGVDRDTGEVKPLFGASGTLNLQGDPFARWGGIRNAWMPPRGEKGLYRVINGVPERHWIAFLPNSWEYTRFGSRNERVISATRYDPSSVVSASHVIVAHSGVNSALDSHLKPQDSLYALNIASLGWVYARVCGITATGTHKLHVSLYREHEGLSLSEWVRLCHAAEPQD